MVGDRNGCRDESLGVVLKVEYCIDDLVFTDDVDNRFSCGSEFFDILKSRLVGNMEH